MTTASRSSGSSTAACRRSRATSTCRWSCTNDVHYLQQGDAQAARHPALHRHRQDGQRREAAALPRRPVLPEDRRGDGGGLRGLSRTRSRNTVRIAERCNVDLPARQNHLPNFDVPAGFTLDELLRARRARGLRSSGCRGCSELAARGRAAAHRSTSTSGGSTYEIEMIKQMKYPGYFLIVWDFIRYAREQGIPVGPGPRLGGRQPRRLLPADHRRRSDRLRPDLRALPQPRARVAARHRHRLLRAAPRRGHRVRHAQVRPRERRADHHVRHDEGARRWCATSAACSTCRTPTSTRSPS